jgi:hypothetical protein
MAAAAGRNPTAVDAFNKPALQGRFGKGGLIWEVWGPRDRVCDISNFKPDVCHGSKQQSAARAGQNVPGCYLRDAQAYMLISMPTDTSTIFGVFQVIRDPPNDFSVTFTPGLNLGPPRTSRKYGTSRHNTRVPHFAADISLLDKVSSLLGKHEH